MKFGIASAFSPVRDYNELAITAESCGWDFVAVSDHVVHPEKLNTPYPYTADGQRRWQAFTPWPDPWVAIAGMAAVTVQIRFITNVFVLPIRNPFSVAKAVGTAAVLSDHRVSLGIGVGWSKDEFALMEQNFHNRGKRANEMIEVMRKLWTGEMVEHRGEYYSFDRLEMSPAPSRPIPILVGGVSDAALRRAARLGDGWISDLHTTDELRTLVHRLNGYRREYGRHEKGFEIVASAIDAVDLDGYRRLEDAGVTSLNTAPWVFYTGGSDSLADKKDGLRRFADDVIAKMEAGS
ncbi:MAG: TIGR03619 family F420-dependent LLM class oxidoreductase [bacterium]|nr:TIGR03619 family F420-dependent LLM class oxidoreductase [bacterium]